MEVLAVLAVLTVAAGVVYLIRRIDRRRPSGSSGVSYPKDPPRDQYPAD